MRDKDDLYIWRKKSIGLDNWYEAGNEEKGRQSPALLVPFIQKENTIESIFLFWGRLV